MDEPIKCWCRKCRKDKGEDEMFAGIVYPDGIARGTCKECIEIQKTDPHNWFFELPKTQD